MSGGRKISEASQAQSCKGVDYSKWDNLEDSDDEKERAAAKAKAAPSKAPEKAHCHNCHETIEKPLRCGVCKVATYCSQKCQKDDWSFHKRACKKPEPKKTPEPKQRPKDPDAKSSAPRPKAKDDVVEDDEKIEGWYRHREWRPSEPKVEFKPQKVESAESGYASKAGDSDTVPRKAAAAGSAWNKAGTWEEKDMTEWAKQSLKEKLQNAKKIDTGTGELAVTEVTGIDGDASIGVIRGSVRYLFDLGLEVKFSLMRMGAAGPEKTEGSVTIKDFTNDAFGGNSDPVITLVVKDASKRRAIEEAVGGKDWPPKKGTLMGNVADAMQSWIAEFQEQK